MDSTAAHNVIKHTKSLRDTDVSISKDYPKEMREQRAYLLKLRRMIIDKTKRKCLLRGNVLIDGNFKITWCIPDGPSIASGESIVDVYGITKEEVLSGWNRGGGQS